LANLILPPELIEYFNITEIKQNKSNSVIIEKVSKW